MGKLSVCNDFDEMDTYHKFDFQSSYVENLYRLYSYYTNRLQHTVLPAYTQEQWRVINGQKYEMSLC